jgi:hypothetical protein
VKKYSFQWARCDSSGAACTVISAAIGVRYTVIAADVGKTLRVTIIATNKNGSAVATSPATAVVVAAVAAAAPPPPPPPPPSPPPPPPSPPPPPPSPPPPPPSPPPPPPPPSSPSPDDGWYSSTSAFNKPIPPGTPYRQNDQSLINALVAHAGAGFGPGLAASAVYLADENTPTVRVHDNHPTCDTAIYQVPIPAGAKSPSQLNPNNSEPTMALMQRGTGIEWDFYMVTGPGETPKVAAGGQVCRNNGDWNAAIVSKFDPATGGGGWQGLANERCCSGAESQIYYPAGMVRPRDTRLSGVQPWPHALSGSYAAVLNAEVWPAKSSAGICADTNQCVPMGARIQLDPNFDCAGTTLLVHMWERQACRTLQVYGYIVVDKPCFWPCSGIGYKAVNSYVTRLNLGRYVDGGGNYQFPFDSAAGYRRMPLEILRHFHVIDWTKWTGA